MRVHQVVADAAGTTVPHTRGLMGLSGFFSYLYSNSYQYYAVAKDIVREEDVRVEYLASCSKDHDLFKGNPNSA
ncbi:hypothetical protein PR048_022419 [Dryococelus australis]|uniref:Uncharacterized protein n=1 Tax=Dryococelus australis TaxID=614101 RepID=A0ABQ9H171_9NEOP|nr:hypothetical protein PR048_022419 [Dryococelus australis]